MEICTEISLLKVITQELKLNYLNLDILYLLWMRLITFPVAWYVLMTASAIIIYIYTKLQISCNEILINFFSKKKMMINDAHLLGHCSIRWSNGPLSDLNRSNDDNLLYNLSCTEVSRHIHNIMKNTTVFEG